MRRAGELLILGGTAEARALALALTARGVAVTTSLAGATSRPDPPAGALRVGGFGGEAGLRDHLAAMRPAVLIDATHPFATRITPAAIAAARAAAVPYLRLERPAWTAGPGDRWHEVLGLEAALALLPSLGRRVLVAAGSRLAASLPKRADLDWIVRSIEPPAALPEGASWIESRPPFTAAADAAFLTRHKIEVVLGRASGGEGARSKLDAARSLCLPVVLLRRPPAPHGVPVVATAEAALAWLEAAGHVPVMGGR